MKKIEGFRKNKYFRVALFLGIAYIVFVIFSVLWILHNVYGMWP